MEYIRIDKQNGEEEKIELKEILRVTEGRGYYTKGTVEQMLNEGHTVQTGFAFYRKA